MPNATVVRTYLELRSPDQLRPGVVDDAAVRFVQLSAADVALFRQLYRDVGGPYHWRDRNALSDEELRTHFASPDVELWVLFDDATPAGFFELRQVGDESVEIVYFGLTAPYVGRGLGKHLLTEAARKAWALGANRVWLHTCTLDSPAALPNYIARGFAPFKTETYERVVDSVA